MECSESYSSFTVSLITGIRVRLDLYRRRGWIDDTHQERQLQRSPRSQRTYVNLSLHAGGIEAALRETTILSTPSLSGSQYQFTFLHSATSWNIGVRCDYILAHCLERYTGFYKCESVRENPKKRYFPSDIFRIFHNLPPPSTGSSTYAYNKQQIFTFTPYFGRTNRWVGFTNLVSM